MRNITMFIVRRQGVTLSFKTKDHSECRMHVTCHRPRLCWSPGGIQNFREATCLAFFAGRLELSAASLGFVDVAPVASGPCTDYVPTVELSVCITPEKVDEDPNYNGSPLPSLAPRGSYRRGPNTICLATYANRQFDRWDIVRARVACNKGNINKPNGSGKKLKSTGKKGKKSGIKKSASCVDGRLTWCPNVTCPLRTSSPLGAPRLNS